MKRLRYWLLYTIASIIVANTVLFSNSLSLIGTIGPAPSGVFLCTHSEHLMVGGWDGVVRLLDSVTLEERKAYMISDSAIVTILFSEKGCCYMISENGLIKKLCPDHEHGISKLSELESRIRSAALHEKQSLLIVGTATGEIMALDTHTGKTVWEKPLHDRGIHSLKIAVEKGCGLSLSYDGELILWGVDDGHVIQRMNAEAFAPGLVLIHERGTFAHIKGEDTIVLRHMPAGDIFAEIQADSIVRVIRASKDETLLILGLENGFVEYWDLDRLERLFSFKAHDDRVTSVEYDHARGMLITGSSDNSVKLWESFSDKLLACNRGHMWHISSLDYSNELGILVSGSFDNTVSVWKLKDRAEISLLEHGNWAVTSLAIDSTGMKVFSGDARGLIRVWDLRGGFVVNEFKGHTDRVQALALSREEELLFSSSWDGTIRVWDLKEGEEIMVLEYHDGSVNTLDVSPDGELLVSGGSDGKIIVWNIADQEIEFVYLRESIRVHCVSFNSVGNILAAGYSDGTVSVFAVSGNMLVIKEKAHDSWVNCVLFSHEDELLVTGSQDGSITVWSPDYLSLLSSQKGHIGGVKAIAIASSEGLIISGGGWLDSTIKIWSIE